MQNAKLKMQKERCEACSLSSIWHFTFLILHSLASSAFNLRLPPIANRYSMADESSSAGSRLFRLPCVADNFLWQSDALEYSLRFGLGS